MNDTVLIVDDSLTVRMDLTEAFAAAGFHPLPCATAAEARAALTHEPLDVIVLDVVLPDGDGIDLLREVRAAPATEHAAVLMLSTEADVHDRIRGLQTGADEYIGKPYDTADVIARTHALLRARHGERHAERPSILLIDDSATFLDAMRQSLENGGYDVVTAGSGEEGLRIAADRRPGAVLVDGVLPGIDGVTVIRRMRLDAALRGVPCVLLTGSDNAGVELRALDAGADAFVRKEEGADVILARLAATLRGTAATDADTASLLGPKRILAVDDSMTYLQELAATLRDEGYDVVLAHSGEEALELLAVQPVDCILLDLLMPGLSGQETCRRIKSAPVMRDIPLIMLTAVEDRATMLEGLGAGADDYIQKTSEMEVLKARVRAQLRRKQFEDENRRIREELLRKEIDATEGRAARALAEMRATHVEELKLKNRELEAFSYSVSHDLRAPLRAIDGFSRILLDEYRDRLDDEGRRLLDIVRNNTVRMAQLIDDILHFSRMGRLDMALTDVDMAALAREVFEELRPATEGRSIRLEVGALPPVRGDRNMLRQVFVNLLANAIKFTRPKDSAVIEVGSTTENGTQVYSVRDNGVGFDMQYLDKLFGVFQRLHSAEEFEGTGIGLAIVKRVIARHGGRVWAEGRLNEGATIYFALPAQEAGHG